MAKDRRRYTVMLIPERGGAARSYKVKLRSLQIVVAVLVLVVAAAAGVGLHQASLVTRLAAESATNAALVEENAALVARINDVDHKMGDAAKKLASVETLEGRIRAMTMLNDPERHLEIGPLPDPGDAADGRATGTDLAGSARATGGPGTARTTSAAFGDERALLVDRLGLLDLRGELLAGEASERARSLEELVRYFDARGALLATTPSIWPVRGYVTSNFGSRIDELTGERRMHPGLDVSAPIGTPVRAPADGRVVFAGDDYGYGKAVEIDHGRGLSTKFGHLSAFKVAPGAEVKRGDIIALTGNTGRSTGPHLHYEVHLYGVPENPRRYILE
ncbi:MAG TPA: M23 family metallopeptidase [Myxococcota bacterium]|nr:M23 family metallopeptidase [Myxococcota bacterium]